MTGRTHDQIAAAGALGTTAALGLPIDAGVALVCGAVAFARAPDYTEPLVHVAHRTWTHWLPTGLAVAAAVFVALALVAPPAESNLAAGFAAGALVGWWLHSLADACTDSACWLLARRRQAILPKRLRIHVYTIVKRKHWLTRKVTTTKRPSVGERCYLYVARAAVLILVFVNVAMVGHDALNPAGHGAWPEQTQR